MARVRLPPLIFLTLTSLVLGGCVGSNAKPASSGAAINTAPAFDDSTGSIHGTVRTEEIQPIPGAQVGIPGTNISTVTDAAGDYSLNYVAPGKVTVAVVALGFQSANQQIEVVAGQVHEKADFVLSLLPTAGPYHSTGIFKLVVGGFELKATPDCMYLQSPTGGGASSTKTCQGSAQCTGGPSGSCNEVHYGHCGDKTAWGKFGCDFDGSWQTILSEAQWTPGTALTGRGWSLETLAPNITRSGATASPPAPDTGSVDQSDKHDWWVQTSKNPIHTRIDTDTFDQGSPTGTSHPVKPEDRCGGFDGFYVPGRCDWVWRIFMGWCTINGLSNGAEGCEKTGPDFAVDPNGTPITIYFSYFIKEKAPEGFSAIPDQ